MLHLVCGDRNGALATLSTVDCGDRMSYVVDEACPVEAEPFVPI